MGDSGQGAFGIAGQERIDELLGFARNAFDPNLLPQALVDLAVESLGDWCAIDVIEKRRWFRRIAARHVDASKTDLLFQSERLYTPALDHPRGYPKVIRSGEPEFIPELDETDYLIDARDCRHLQVLRGIACRGYVCLPLESGDRRYGAITVGISAGSERRLTATEIERIVRFTERAAELLLHCSRYSETLEAVRLREEFLSVAAHELRTPLSTLCIQSEVLVETIRRGGTGEPRIVTMATRIERQARRLAQLSGNLFDAARIMGERFALVYERFDLAALVREVCVRFEDELHRGGYSLSISIERAGERVAAGSTEGVIEGSWDRSRIEQVITNLVSNAIRYGAGRPIAVRVATEGRHAIVEISDSGIGIDESNFSRIFERFERVSSPAHCGGLGLGLYIVRQIVEAHQGSIRVESRLGAGAKFTIALPLATSDS